MVKDLEGRKYEACLKSLVQPRKEETEGIPQSASSQGN